MLNCGWKEVEIRITPQNAIIAEAPHTIHLLDIMEGVHPTIHLPVTTEVAHPTIHLEATMEQVPHPLPVLDI